VASRVLRASVRFCACVCFFYHRRLFPRVGEYLFAFRPASNMERALNVYRVYTRRVRDDGSLTARATDRARYYVVRGGKGELSGQRSACTRLRVLPVVCRRHGIAPRFRRFFSPSRVSRVSSPPPGVKLEPRANGRELTICDNSHACPRRRLGLCSISDVCLGIYIKSLFSGCPL